MPLTILIDLDATLLINDINKFIPKYLKKLSEQLLPGTSGLVEKEVMNATRKMVENRSPQKTLEEVFDSYFYPAINNTKQNLTGFIHDFYTNIFPDLRGYTSPSVGAIDFITKIKNSDVKMAVATNPVFPFIATQQRLQWAELPVAENQFSIISSYEKFHFTKPSPAYYAELMGQLGWPEGPVVMVGDDYQMDILPANLLNIPAFWLEGSQATGISSDSPLVASGDFSSLPTWIHEISHCDFPDLHYGRRAIVAILRSTLAVIDTLLRDYSREDWVKTTNDFRSSPVQTIVDLMEYDREVNFPQISQYLRKNSYIIPGKINRELSHPSAANMQNPDEIFLEFLSVREALITYLETIPDEVMKKMDNFPDSGCQSLLDYFNSIALNDQARIRKLVQLLPPKKPPVVR